MFPIIITATYLQLPEIGDVLGKKERGQKAEFHMRLLRKTETGRGSAPVTPNYTWGREGGQKYAKKCDASFEWPLKTLIVEILTVV